MANAGLLLPVTLAHHLGLGELVARHVDLGRAPGRANTGDKMMTLVASALAGGDCIDDADALRAGGTDRVLGCVVKAPSTLGTFLRSFRWGHVRQLDRVSRELLAGAWTAGAGPGEGSLTIDLDSTVCETYGLSKEGAQRHNYAGQRGYHPLLAVAAITGDVLMCRLRQVSVDGSHIDVDRPPAPALPPRQPGAAAPSPTAPELRLPAVQRTPWPWTTMTCPSGPQWHCPRAPIDGPCHGTSEYRANPIGPHLFRSFAHGVGGPLSMVDGIVSRKTTMPRKTKGFAIVVMAVIFTGRA